MRTAYVCNVAPEVPEPLLVPVYEFTSPSRIVARPARIENAPDYRGNAEVAPAGGIAPLMPPAWEFAKEG